MSGSAQEKGTAFDRHLVLEQLGGWRGMVDASLPTIAFIVGNSVRGLTVGIWSAVVLPGGLPHRRLPLAVGHGRPTVSRRSARTTGCR